MARFQYIPPDEPPRVTIRITIFLAGLLLLLAGSIVGLVEETSPWAERLAIAGGWSVVVAFVLTILEGA